MAENKTFDEKEYITKMYESALESQKQGLKQDYDQNNARFDELGKQLQKQTDANLTRTYVEAAKDKQNYNEVQNAYGLSSGAMGQARLAQDNQLQADLTALRAAQQTADAGIEQERALLAKEFSAAIQKAQADNDLAKVQALYEQAQREEDRLLKQQEAAAQLMAGTGDYSRLAALYGLTAEEVAVLNGQSKYTGDGDLPYTPSQRIQTHAQFIENALKKGKYEDARNLVAVLNQAGTTTPEEQQYLIDIFTRYGY